jgi:glycosyltransferase involved in cell wall biosynthesis
MRVLVFEQWLGGHFTNYLRAFVPRLAPLVDEVVLAITVEANDSPWFRSEFVPSLPDNVRVEAGVPRAGMGIRERPRVARHFLEAVKRTRPDHVFVTSADGPGLALGLLARAGWPAFSPALEAEAAFHAGYADRATTSKQKLKELVYRAAYSASPWSRTLFVNPLYFEFVRKRGWRVADRCGVLPDPVPPLPQRSREAARKELGLAEDGRYVSVVGSLDHRKAVLELCAAFRGAGLRASDRLLLAGNIDPRYRERVRADHGDLVESGRIVLMDRYLTDRDLELALSASDLVSTPFLEHAGLSSLLLKGLAAGRPILANDFGWCGEIVRRFDLGECANARDPEAFGCAIARGLDRSSEPLPDAARALLAFHTEGNFAETLLVNLRARVGQPAPEPLIDWDWVLSTTGKSLGQRAEARA